MVGAPKHTRTYTDYMAWFYQCRAQVRRSVCHNTSSIETFHYPCRILVCCTHITITPPRPWNAWCKQLVERQRKDARNHFLFHQSTHKMLEHLFPNRKTLIAPQNAKLYVPNGYNRLCFSIIFFLADVVRHSWSRFQFNIPKLLTVAKHHKVIHIQREHPPPKMFQPFFFDHPGLPAREGKNFVREKCTLIN
jgi:hypothetical protein